MPAAATVNELQAVTEKEYAKLEKVIASLSSEQALLKDDDGVSIKDVIAHRAHWIELFFGWYEDGLAGKEVFFPAKGYKWNDLKAYNTALRRQQAGLSWEEAVKMLRDQHARFVEFINKNNNEELYGGPMKGAGNSWTPGRWAEAAGPSHYRSAAKYIRQRLKQL